MNNIKLPHIVLAGVLILSVLSFFVYVYNSLFGENHYTPTTYRYTLIKNVWNASGQNSESSLTGTIEVLEDGYPIDTIEDVPANELFSKQRMGEFGRDKIEPNGVGLEVWLYVINSPDPIELRKNDKQLHEQGVIISRKVVKMKGFESTSEAENTTWRKRLRVVNRAKAEYEEALATLLRPRASTVKYFIGLDITEGYKWSALVNSVSGQLSQDATRFGKICTGLEFYRLGGSYQGGRRIANSFDGPDYPNARQWLLAYSGGQDYTSLYRGIVALLAQATQSPADRVVVHLYTDGMENNKASGISIFDNPSLLDQPDVLRRHLNLSQLSGLSKLDITLHAIPQYEDNQGIMFRSLDFLRDELEKNGVGKVTIKPF